MKYRYKKEGLSLVEVLIALAILMIIIFPISNMVLTSFKIEREGDYKLKGNTLAQMSMESLKNNDDLNTDLGFQEVTENKNLFLDENETIDDFKLYKTQIENIDYYIKVKDKGEFSSTVNPSFDEASPFDKPKDSAGNYYDFDGIVKVDVNTNGEYEVYFGNSTTTLMADYTINIYNDSNNITLEFKKNGSSIRSIHMQKIADGKDFLKIILESFPNNLNMNINNSEENTLDVYLVEKVKDGVNNDYNIYTDGKVIVNTKMENEDGANIHSHNRLMEVKVYKLNNRGEREPILIQSLNGYTDN